MFALANLAVLLSLALSVTSLATPYVHRNIAHHRNVAARVAPIEEAIRAVAEVVAPTIQRPRKRGNGRCKVRSTSSSATAEATSSGPVANVAPSPTVITSSSSFSPTPEPSTTAQADPSTNSPPPAPTTTFTPPPAPSPTTQQAPPPPATSSPPSSGGSGGNVPSYLQGTNIGQGTFYATGLGSCGITNTDSDHIAAVSHLLYDTFPGYDGANPNNNPVCGRQVTATYQGKSVTVTITDRCTGCALTDLDFSPSAFDILADPSVGRISGMAWTFD
ncbi:hypothetical protein JAAARDRAFT_29698 [Jaapia argillacea MUCL 33604]|uniref:RlpA-like protein double-psi beta-barrel domain-containing protein n=1 Tax=Jaapia argillacea MUCL 33604 TaxID=933084 RepID=A0A067QJH1_9AGAM|nr:hypothetical protein JAAARDRAFT_29698 [Jaapia argillacea MUCL 33604]